MTTQTFALDLKKFADKYGKKADLVVRKVVLDLGKAVVMRTPVGDPSYWKGKAPKGYVGGRARGNWQHGTRLKKSQFDVTDKKGGMSMARILTTLPRDAGGKIHYLSNNVPYILLLEKGTLSPRQAPLGMVAVTIKQFSRFMRDATKGVNK